MKTAINIKDIDWNGAWKEINLRKSFGGWSSSEYWDKRAPQFANHAKETNYPADFIKIMSPEPDWTVLDVGSAAGTLALPLSGLVKQVTALDISGKMLDLLDGRAAEKNIKNIKTVKAGWEDDWDAVGIAPHDVLIASRSLIVDDIRWAVEKMNRFARKKVYASAVVGDGPFDRSMFEAVGRPLVLSPDYIYLYNLLRSMDIYANVNMVTMREVKSYEGIDDAIRSLGWMLQELTPSEEGRLREYLVKHLVKKGQRWELDYEKVTRWAVVWWERS